MSARAPKWKKREWEFTKNKLGDKVLCERCGCTYDTFADKCKADLAEVCDGFLAIDEVKKEYFRTASRSAT